MKHKGTLHRHNDTVNKTLISTFALHSVSLLRTQYHAVVIYETFIMYYYSFRFVPMLRIAMPWLHSLRVAVRKFKRFQR